MNVSDENRAKLIAKRLRNYLDITQNGTDLREKYLAAKSLLYLAERYPQIAAEILGPEFVSPVRGVVVHANN